MRKVIAILVCGLVLVPPALACRCTEPKSTRVAYVAAQAALVARVLEVRAVPRTDGVTAVLLVSQAWKKDLPTHLTIVSATTCKYDLLPNREYLLYLAHDPKMLEGRDPETYTTGLCLGNQPLPQSNKAVQWLQKHARASRFRPAS